MDLRFWRVSALAEWALVGLLVVMLLTFGACGRNVVLDVGQCFDPGSDRQTSLVCNPNLPPGPPFQPMTPITPFSP